jgi:MFS family permease
MIQKQTFFKFIVLLGIVSLFADMTYEGARSITGPYLGLLGASAATVAIVSGFGEFIGYAVRILSGFVSDRTRKYWTITILGYMINLFAVPLLALAGRWEIAAGLIIAERFGKAIRTPARDAMLSYAASKTGRGRAFGIHEALDQIGAIIGPFIVVVVFYLGGEYRTGFLVLLVPALLALIVLFAAKRLQPEPGELETMLPKQSARNYSKSFWLFVFGASFIAVGFVDFPLVAFHFSAAEVVSIEWIPIFYAVAMAADAVAALLLGSLYDRWGFVIIIPVVVISSLAVPLLFVGGGFGVLAGMICWGISLGAQESVIRAGVATLSAKERRGAAFGVFHTLFGVSWFLGSIVIGILYDISIVWLIAFSILFQLTAIPFFLMLVRDRKTTNSQ